MSLNKGLTLAEIIECLVDQNNEVDSKLLNILLYTYRSYCEPWDIIQLIDKRLKYLNDEDFVPDYKSSGIKGFTKAIITLFNGWLTIPFAYDFHELPNFRSLNFLLTNIREWPLTISFIKSSDSFKHSFENIETMIGKVIISFNSMDTCVGSDYGERAVDCSFRDSISFDFLSQYDEINSYLIDFSTETVAIGLSYLDQQVLKKLKLPELIKYTQRLPAPTVTQIINNYNQLHNVVKLTVKQPRLANRQWDQLQCSDKHSPVFVDDKLAQSYTETKTDQRHQVIEKWIFVAQILHHLRNFSSLVAILTALNSPELKNCIKVLNKYKCKKLYNLYQSLLKAIDPYINQNKEEIPMGGNTLIDSFSAGFNYFSKNKGNLKNLHYHPLEIPYLGIYLRNMTYINDAFPDYLKSEFKVYNGSEDRVINMDKCRRQFDVMAQVRLFISALNSLNIKEDEAFSNWFVSMQIETRKTQRYSSNGTLSSSMESLKSDNSNNSSNSADQPLYSNSCESKPVRCMSYERLSAIHTRPRIQSTPLERASLALTRNRSMGTNISAAHNNEPKVATVKLKESRNNLNKKSNINDQSQMLHKSTKPGKKSQTISNGAMRLCNREVLPEVYRSSHSLENKADRKSINLDSILYMKIQIYENDKTTDFIERVLNKFGKSHLSPNDFEVVQILDNGKEIIIALKANLFYALAEKSEYLIEVRRQQHIVMA